MEKKQILLIEDDLIIREALRDILEDEGYKVEMAANGQVAIDYLRSTPHLPHVILLDIMMPIMDGFEFRDQQLADPKLSQIPTIPLSADGNVTEKSKKLKAEIFLRKPVELDALLEAVKSML